VKEWKATVETVTALTFSLRQMPFLFSLFFSLSRQMRNLHHKLRVSDIDIAFMSVDNRMSSSLNLFRQQTRPGHFAFKIWVLKKTFIQRPHQKGDSIPDWRPPVSCIHLHTLTKIKCLCNRHRQSKSRQKVFQGFQEDSRDPRDSQGLNYSKKWWKELVLLLSWILFLHMLLVTNLS